MGKYGEALGSMVGARKKFRVGVTSQGGEGGESDASPRALGLLKHFQGCFIGACLFLLFKLLTNIRYAM